MAPRGRRKLKDGYGRTKMFTARLPPDLVEWMVKEAARRTLATGRKVSCADIAVEALREKRTRSIWARAKVTT